MSRSVCLYAPNIESAVRHFEREMRLTVVNQTDDEADLSGDDIRLHIEKGAELGPILEIIVPDIEAAKTDLLSQGWRVIIWEGREGRCRLSNPSGTMFNVIEEASAFDSEEFERKDSI